MPRVSPWPPAAHPLDAIGFDTVLQVNLRAEATLVQAFLPALRDAQPGSAIVGIASIEGLIGHGAIPAYTASKHGVIGLTRALAHALGSERIRVNAVCPGYIETPMFSPALAMPGARESYLSKIPMQRLGVPQDVARLVRFLLSDEAEYIHGSAVVVDGGVTAAGGQEFAGGLLTRARVSCRRVVTGVRGGAPPWSGPNGSPCAWATHLSRSTLMAQSPEAAAYTAALEVIGASEPRIAAAIVDELANQRRQLKLIASENYASPAVLLAMGTWFSDKYAEGTPGHRFYAGCEVVDQVESIANEHATALFGADHAYVQPHSGIDANLVAFWSILAKRVEQPRLESLGVNHVNDLDPEAWEALRQELNNQRMIGMSLDAGGHLTHGFRPNISGKLFNQRSYGVDPVTEQIDYDAVRALALEFRPLVVVAGYSAYPATRTSASCVRSPTRSTRRSWSTWRTSPVSSRAAFSPATSIRCRTRTWSRRRRTSRCAAPAAGSCCAPPSTPSSSTRVVPRSSAVRCHT